MFKLQFSALPPVTALIALAACQAETTSIDAANAPAAVKRQVVQAAGKATPPIDVGYKVLGTPAIGEPLAIELSVSSGLPGATFSVSLQPRDDLLLGTGQERAMEVSRAAITTMGADAEQSLVQRVSVIPQSEGRSYLVVSVSTSADEGLASRVLAVPIQVGDLPPRMQTNGTVVGEGDDAVVSMPAKQTQK